ncbi:MAG: leucyl aminopeptidase family protein [Fibrobacteria bacterium]|nr:leucyl aminopeptidase family protein [Fibrobacteria bacterium]
MKIKITTNFPKKSGHSSSYYPKQLICLLTDTKKPFAKIPGESAINKAVVEIIKEISDKKGSAKTEVLHSTTNQVLLSAASVLPGLSNQECIRVAGFQAMNAAKGRSVSELMVPVESVNPLQVRAAIEGMAFADYQFQQYKTSKKSNKEITLTLICSKNQLSHCRIIAKETTLLFEGINFGKDLINTPGSDLVPTELTTRIKKLIKNSSIKMEIKSKQQLIKEGFNGLITVGKGSTADPCMVTLSYNGSSKSKAGKKPHLAFVGKGVTFDTGGISLKPGSSMWEMKSDMSGAATALAAIYTIAKLQLKIKATAILVLAENRPGNPAVLPGDIFKAKNGKTVMVENTDAEGRLILTDGLAQAGIKNATHIIDIATLTGSIVRALGTSMAGLFSNNTALARQIKQAGSHCGEKFWHMPLEEEYRSHIDDSVADIKNLGKTEAGAITASLFLREFVPKETAWAHLDIAGTAFSTTTWKYHKPGATGWGIRTLVEIARMMS